MWRRSRTERRQRGASGEGKDPGWRRVKRGPRLQHSVRAEDRAKQYEWAYNRWLIEVRVAVGVVACSTVALAVEL